MNAQVEKVYEQVARGAQPAATSNSTLRRCARSS